MSWQPTGQRDRQTTADGWAVASLALSLGALGFLGAPIVSGGVGFGWALAMGGIVTGTASTSGSKQATAGIVIGAIAAVFILIAAVTSPV